MLKLILMNIELAVEVWVRFVRYMDHYWYFVKTAVNLAVSLKDSIS